MSTKALGKNSATKQCVKTASSSYSKYQIGMITSARLYFIKHHVTPDKGKRRPQIITTLSLIKQSGYSSSPQHNDLRSHTEVFLDVH